MKKASVYRLTVLFNNGSIWDLQVLSINAEAVTMLLPRNETSTYYVVSTTIKLIEYETRDVKNEFLCKVLD